MNWQRLPVRGRRPAAWLPTPPARPLPSAARPRRPGTTFFRRRRWQPARIAQPVPTVPGPARERRLTALIGPIGLGYFRQWLPTPRLVLCLSAGVAWCVAAFAGDPVVLAACSLALSGLLLHWPRHGARRWPTWHLLALLAVIALAFVPALGELGFVRNLLYAVTALCLAQALGHLLDAAWLALKLQRSARRLDDASLLALLPPDAREDAERWRRGDDSKAAELRQVIRLAALWLAMTSVGACAPQPPPRAQRSL